MAKLNFRITEQVTEAETAAVFRGLLEYNLARLEDKNPRSLAVFAENAAGIRGGLIGETHGNWLSICYLWVAEAERSQGVGSDLLAQAERAAAARGCKYAFVDTFSFQAPGFYLRHGYQQVFALTEYPLTGQRFYYTKQLGPVGEGAGKDAL